MPLVSERVVPRDEAFDGGRVNLLPTLLGKAGNLRWQCRKLSSDILSASVKSGDKVANLVRTWYCFAGSSWEV